MAQPECTAQPRRLFRTETVCRDGEAAAAVILFLSSGERAANYRTLPRRTRFTMASRTTAPRNEAIRAERLKSPRVIVPPLTTSHAKKAPTKPTTILNTMPRAKERRGRKKGGKTGRTRGRPQQ